MADSDAAPFASLLRRHRGAQGLTQDELASRSGISSQAISMLERGARRTPRSTTIELLAQALRLDAAEREALHAAARRGGASGQPPATPELPESPRPARRERPALRWRRGAAVLSLALVAGLAVAVPLAWWRAHAAPAGQMAALIGARVYDWPAANQAVGPLQTQRVYHVDLPASFAGTAESRLPAGVVPIVSYRTPTTDVVSYVRSVTRRLLLIYHYNPEPNMDAPTFVSQFEEQADLIRSAGNPEVRVAMSAEVFQYQAVVNPSAAKCAYIPPPAYVDYYLAAVYEPWLQGIEVTDGGAFLVWQRCTNGQDRTRGLAEYGLGLGMPGSQLCQSESKRADVMRSDMQYLHRAIPDLGILEYWWADYDAKPLCHESYQFPAASETGRLWRTIANRTFGF